MNRFVGRGLEILEEREKLSQPGDSLDDYINQIFPKRREHNLGPIAYTFQYFRRRRNEKRIEKIKKGLLIYSE